MLNFIFVKLAQKSLNGLPHFRNIAENFSILHKNK